MRRKPDRKVVHVAHSVHVAPPPLTVAVTSLVVEMPNIQMLLDKVGIIVPPKLEQEEVLLAQYVMTDSCT